jgi:inhibitor of KinA
MTADQQPRHESVELRFLAVGDTALSVEFGDRIDRVLSDRVLRLRERLRETDVDGIVETVPTFRSLMVHYDPCRIGGARLADLITNLLGEGAAERKVRRRWCIPACYAQDCAPDLAEVAERTSLSTDEVIRRHAGVEYHVYMIGFVPGYPYMGDLPAGIDLPRRREPRTKVPPGSVAIAAGMTGIYPIESPGGWHLIGVTPIRLFDVRWRQPSLLAPGDVVRFQPIGLDEYAAIQTAVATDAYKISSTEIEEWSQD